MAAGPHVGQREYESGRGIALIDLIDAQQQIDGFIKIFPGFGEAPPEQILMGARKNGRSLFDAAANLARPCDVSPTGGRESLAPEASSDAFVVLLRFGPVTWRHSRGHPFPRGSCR